MIRTQILLTPTLYDLLKAQAEKSGKSLSRLIREAVETHFLIRKKTGGQVLRSMVKHAVAGSRLPKDIATNDSYLYSKKSHYGLR